tara:strand:+ start:1326 stop:1472 length:147 start_codon:yes stop_codon:yes gene_type:complete
MGGSSALAYMGRSLSDLYHRNSDEQYTASGLTRVSFSLHVYYIVTAQL